MDNLPGLLQAKETPQGQIGRPSAVPMGAGSGLGAPALLPPSTDGLSRRGSAAYVEAATPRRGKTSPFNWHRGASSSRGAATAWLWDTAGHEPSGGSERDRDSVTQRPFSRGLPQPTESPVALTRGAGPNQDSPWEAPRHFSHPKKKLEEQLRPLPTSGQ